MQFIEQDQKPNFQKNTIFIGVPSIGSVGQLCIDLLINSFQAKRVGFIYTKFVTPVVGNDCFTEEKKGKIHTSVEVYQFEELTFVQIRAPISNPKLFSTNFVDWIKKEGFSKLVILSSANASWCMDKFLKEEQPMYRSLKKSLFNVSQLEEKEIQKFVIGTTKHIIESINNEIEFELLLMFCNEGENLLHSFDMADRVTKYCSKTIQLQPPSSWKYFYGPPPEEFLLM